MDFSSGIVITGNNDAITTSYADLWKQNIVRTDPAAGFTLGVSSGNAADASAGTGIRTLRVFGVNANFVPIQEDFTMNGQTKVVSKITNWFRVNGMEALTVGSGGVAAGEVYCYDQSDTVTAGVPQTATKIFGRIAAGFCHMLIGNYTTFAGERLRLRKFIGQIADATTTVKYGKFRITIKSNVTGIVKHYTLTGCSSNSSPSEIEGGMPLIVADEKSDIHIQAIASASGGEAVAHAFFERF